MVEYHHDFGINVVRFQIAWGGRRWYIVGCYLAPYDASTIERIVIVIGQCPHTTNLLVAGNFNACLVIPKENTWDEEVSVALEPVVIKDILENFLPRHNSWPHKGSTLIINPLGW